jgi:geranylgeranyl diphosphate synthase type I
MSKGIEAASAFLKRYRVAADARLEALLLAREAKLEGMPFGVARYHALLRDYALRGGKRLRGALVVLGHQAVVPATSARALEASLAFELLHAFLLAYDDFMDRDEVRRGGKALHVLATEEARARGAADPAHRGISATMLLGLLAQSAAFECLERADADRVARRYFDHVSEGVTLGQLLDVIAVDAKEATLAEVSVIHQLKTGLYTTEGPLVFGALLAGAPLEGPVVAALKGYAGPLGEAFQLVDDVLGAVGDAEETGKPASGDLREGKRSAVIEEALARLEGAEKQRFSRLAGRPLDAEEAAEAKALILASGAAEAVRERARALAVRARAALGAAAIDASARETLHALAELVVERQN